MGMFDTVTFTCSHCRKQMEVQNKSGPCELQTYPETAVPGEIAADITDKVVVCDHCHRQNVIVSALSRAVVCYTRPLEEEDHIFEGRVH